MPEPTDAKILGDLPSYYGVRVIEFEDSPHSDVVEFVALTHDRRRALAAVNRCLRERWGGKLKLVADRKRWTAFQTNCGCGVVPEDEHLDGPDGPWCGCDCDSDLPPCGDRFEWLLVDAQPALARPATEVTVR